MRLLFLDIETYSDTDLPAQGLRRYALDPSTGLWCQAFWFSDEDECRFHWGSDPFPQDIIDHIEAGGEIVAHNAQFERELYEFVICPDHDVPPPRPEQWTCTLAMALVNGHPAGLDQLCKSLGVPQQKNAEGSRLIREYCAPGHLTEFKEGDADLMRAYCIEDVEAMAACYYRMRPLSDVERREYVLNAKINDRGIPIDTRFVAAALGYADEMQEDAAANITKLTDGKMTSARQRKARDEILLPLLEDHHIRAITVYKKGEKKLSFDREHRDVLLNFEDLDSTARELLEYIEAAGSSALRKYQVAHNTHVDGLVHHGLLWHGAQTGRFSSRGLQIHNIRRDAYNIDEAERLIGDVVEDYELDQPARTLARLLRSMIHDPRGIYFVDWSAIEGRVAPWLTADSEAETRLNVFKSGGDIYVYSAQEMFSRKDIDDNLRQCGKVAELSLGYGGAVGALVRMAKNYGQHFSDAEARDIVDRWRETNRWAVQIWRDFEDAAHDAIMNENEPYTAGRCIFMCRGDYLYNRLPSGALISYAKPDIEMMETPFGEDYLPTFQSPLKPAATAKGRIRMHLRGALLFQNAVQGTAASILREALLRADDAGLDIRLHVHDEIVGVGPQEDGDRLNEIMLTVPDWAKGLPLATGGVKWQSRFGK